MKKSFYLLLFLLLTIFSCSGLLDWSGGKGTPQFTITGEALAGKQVRIIIPDSEGSRHYRDAICDIETEEEEDGEETTEAYITGYNYFWGYYVYRSDQTPYHDHYLRGFVARSRIDGASPPDILIGFTRQVLGGPILDHFDTGNKEFIDDCEISCPG